MNLKQRYQQFKEWQQQPYQVAPLSQEEHTCATCGTTYQGNYCPRCGQSYRIGRYSLKSAMLLLLDVWGLGNRGMFRSIRDLLLRPGYMIRDYLGGMQMAYFPPFKMFFLLATLSLLVNSGFNIKGENKFEEVMESYQADFDKDIQKENEKLLELQERIEEVNNTINYQKVQLSETNAALEKRNVEINSLMSAMMQYTSNFDVNEDMKCLIRNIREIKCASLVAFYIEKDVCLNDDPLFEYESNENYISIIFDKCCRPSGSQQQ